MVRATTASRGGRAPSTWHRAGATALACIGLVALPAREARGAIVADYRVELTPRGEGDLVHHQVTIDHRVSPGETRRDGFVNLGHAPVSSFHTDAPGARLERARASFLLPPPDERGRSALSLSFEQPVAIEEGWSGKVGRVSWSLDPSVPASAHRVVVRGPHAVDGLGFTCQGEGAARECTRGADAPSVVEIPLRPSPLHLYLAWLLAVTGVVALLALAARRRRSTLLARREATMPDSGAAATGLTAAERRALGSRIVAAALGLIGVHVAALVSLRTSLPFPLALALAVALAGLPLLLVVALDVTPWPFVVATLVVGVVVTIDREEMRLLMMAAAGPMMVIRTLQALNRAGLGSEETRWAGRGPPPGRMHH